MTYSININNTTDEQTHFTIFQKPVDAPDFPVSPWRTFNVDPHTPSFSFEIPGPSFEYAMSAGFDAEESGTPMLKVEPGGSYCVSGNREAGCRLEAMGNG